MTKNQVIEKLFVGKNFNDCLSKMEPAHLREDLKMEVALIVCEWSEEKILKLELDKALEFYVVRVILNLIKSKTSPFAKMYRAQLVPIEVNGHVKGFKPGSDYATDRKIRASFEKVEAKIYNEQSQRESVSEREIREQIEDLAIAEIENLYWYDAEMIRLYLKHGNFRAIEKETGIPFISCYKNIKKSLAILKKKAVDSVNKPVFTKEEKVFIQNNKPCREY